MKRLSKIGLGATAIAVAVVSGFTLLANAWGPSNRETFTLEKPASYVTFNSITNNKTEGDERYFVSAQEAPAEEGKWRDTTVVEDGKDYIVKMYVHNNAGANLKLVAENVKAYAYINNQGSQTQVSGKITWNHASSKINAVWDETTFKSANGEEFTLNFVSGSAEFTNADSNKKVRKFSLSNNLLNNGVALGYDQMDGKIPGCFDYSGVVTYKVRASFKNKPVTPNPSYELQKQVQADGSNTWSENVEMKAGQTVQYRLYFKNTGNVTLKDVVLKDELPEGLTYVKGSTKLGDKTVADGIVGDGLNIGNYEAGKDAYVYFKATVDKADKCEKGKKLTNTVKTNPKYDVDTNGDGKTDSTKEVGEKQDTADVTINCEKKTCDDFGGKEKPEGDYTEKKEYKDDDGETIICYVEKKVTCDDFGAKDKPEGNFTVKQEFTTTSGKTIVCYVEKVVIPANGGSTPVAGTPASLPKSGPAEVISSVIGLSSLGMASAYYISSRKRLQ